jgi:hypothetical protein
MIQNKTEVLNLKSRKTQVPIGYLTLIFFVMMDAYGWLKCCLGVIFMSWVWLIFMVFMVASCGLDGCILVAMSDLDWKRWSLIIANVLVWFC